MARPAPDRSTRDPARRPTPRPPKPKRHLFGWVALGVAVLAVVAVAFAFAGSELEPTPINPPGVGDASAASPPGAPATQRRWRNVITVSGSASRRTPAFALHGVQTRLRYRVEDPGGQGSPNAAIYVRGEGAEAGSDVGAPAVTATQAGSHDARLQRRAGSYYLEIEATNASWSVAIEEYR
jgi:hypothetical protein